MTLRVPPRILRPLAVLLSGSALVLASCDQPKPATPAAPEAPAGKVRPDRTAEPISWDPARKAFVLNGEALKPVALWTFETGTDGFEAAGAEANTVLVRVTRNQDTARWDGALFWKTAQHGEAAAFATKPVRGTDPAVGETTVMVYDMANPRKGGDDWVKSVITGLRLDLDDDAGGEFTLHQVAIVNIPGGAAPEAQPAPTPPAAP